MTSFRPDPTIRDVVAVLRHQVDTLVVVDDGSGDGYTTVLDDLRDAGALVIARESNDGIAAALNDGMRRAFDTGAESVVTFDQDSVPSGDFVARLLEAREHAEAAGIAVGPVVPEFFAGVSQVRERRGAIMLSRHAIQSGMLVSAETWRRVGALRDGLFIDLVDTEFEMRCARGGLATVAAPGLRMGHSLGRQYERRMLGRRVLLPGIPPVVTLSSPFRYYYRVRNRIIVNRLHGRHLPSWAARDTLLEILHFANALVLARPRRALWRVYRTAVSDARRGVMGRMDAGTAATAAMITWSAPEVVLRPVDR
ncbi:glycosyltransferase [Microbacterium enclense]|uniref:glycosyltransferase n=1 Tax=Microbacterium enclense TaxID=993073 RepID=UPI003F7EF238